MEDKHIIALLWNRSESAIDALRVKFGKVLFKIGMNILNNPQDAEEAENDTYLAVWNTIPPATPDPLPPFVYKLGKNTALKLLRARKAQKRNSSYDISLDELADIIPSNTLEEDLDARALGRTINSFLDELDAENRNLFVRRYWFGDEINILTREFRLSQANVYVKLHRIRNKLKEHLDKEGFWL